MSKKLRVSVHNGRQGNPVHNGREGTLGVNIDQARTPDNTVWRWDAYFRPESTIEGSERYYYDNWFGEWLIDQNARYRADGHPERQKEPDQIYRSKQWRPEETILQVGNLQDGSVDPGTFRAMVSEYVHALQAWTTQNGEPYKILNYVIHEDESTPHAHIRKVWQYRDADGNLRPGQAKALEAAGVDLPDPAQPQGRYNNRKMTWDAMARRKWQEICEAYGIPLETEPLPHKRTLPLADLVREREADYKARQAQAAQEATRLAQEMANLQVRARHLQAQERALEGRTRALEEREAQVAERETKAQEATRLAQAARKQWDIMIADLPQWQKKAVAQRYAKAQEAASTATDGAARRIMAEYEEIEARNPARNVGFER